MSKLNEEKKTLTYCVADWFQRNTQSMKNHWLGKFLTLIDASVSDPEQRKAIKDVLKSYFWEDSLETRYLNYLVGELSQTVGDGLSVLGHGGENNYTPLEEPDYKYSRSEK